MDDLWGGNPPSGRGPPRLCTCEPDGSATDREMWVVPHVREEVPNTDVEICYAVDHAAKTVTVLRIHDPRSGDELSDV